MLYQICKLLCQNFENSSHIWHNVPANKHMTMSKIWLLHTCYVLHVLRAVRATCCTCCTCCTHTYLSCSHWRRGRWGRPGAVVTAHRAYRGQESIYEDEVAWLFGDKKLYSIFFSHRRNFFQLEVKKLCITKTVVTIFSGGIIFIFLKWCTFAQ